jgi:hypothetical protein
MRRIHCKMNSKSLFKYVQKIIILSDNPVSGIEWNDEIMLLNLNVFPVILNNLLLKLI